MTNESANTTIIEKHTWLEPGVWRKPCIVHVTMVANARQALFGKLAHNGSEAVIEKTPIGTPAAYANDGVLYSIFNSYIFPL